MFNRARWWSEKNKVKEVFKLQFHASQLTQIGEDGLMISVVPADSGKPTVKLEKVPVRDGICFWGNPVYETVKFNRDARSGKIQEKIYHFIVGTGSSKSGVVGEASIDFSSYVEATKVTVVSLPLRNSKTEALLHVSIQRIQELTEQRDIEGNENGLREDQRCRSQFGNNYSNGTVLRSSAVERDRDEVTESNVNCQQSSGSDISMSGSESSSGIETPWEPRVKNDCSATNQKAGGCISPLMSQEPKSDEPALIFEEHVRSWDWLENPVLESRTDDSLITLTEAFAGQHSDKDIVIAKLKSEVTSLSRQVEMSNLELQTLRKQIVKETKRGQDLSKEITCLKEERDALKGECGRFKTSERDTNGVKTTATIGFSAVDSQAMVVELRQELNHAKEMNANLRIQLQKTQESNSELILAVRDLDEMLKQNKEEISSLPSGSLMKDGYENSREVGGMCRLEDYDEQKALEELVKEHTDAKEAYLIEQQIMDLQSEIEIYKRHKDELEMQMEQLALDYEILKQQNHDLSCRLEQRQMHENLEMQYECSSPDAAPRGLQFKVENLEIELEKQSKEYADSLIKISELEARAKSLEEELEKLTQRFEADVGILTQSKVEQEQRAIRAEETLKKLRWKNANTVERLQADFRTLSVQMTSTFEANEKVVVKALSEANQLQLQKSHLEEMLRKASEEHESVMSHYETRLHQLTNQLTSMTNQMEQMQLDAKDKAVQQEHEKKEAEETQRILTEKILLLREEIEIQKAENKTILAENGSKESLIQELEQMKKSIKEMELLVEKESNERMELENKASLVKNEAEEMQEELKKVRCLAKDKEVAAGNLQSELDFLQAQCMKLKQSLLAHELEKEKLRKQVSQLTRDLKKRDDAFKNMEKKLKDGVGMVKVGPKATKPLSRGSKEMENLKDRIKLLEGQVKLKETALETSSITFLEKEKDLHNKIEELEAKLELFEEQCSAPKNTSVEELNPSCSPREETRKATKSGLLETVEVSLSCDGNIDELKNEVALLKDRNRGMEKELKEMHERYSEISLKFAEVEGERQQLVMTLRNLKNTNKRT